MGILCAIVRLYFDAEPKQWSKLLEYIPILARKRGQLKQAITDMVRLAMSWIDGLETGEKLNLMTTLTEVTDGKIFVEVEKARLTKMMADMKEAEGNVEEAANLLQEVQVEAFGAMEKREKTEYILHQMRLVLLNKNYVRTHIIAKKINPRLLDDENFQDLKITYFQHMIEYWLHEKKNLDVCKCYLAIFNTPLVQTDESKWILALQNHALYLVLAPYDNEQDDMLHKIDKLEAKKFAKIPPYRDLVKLFLKREIAPWPLVMESELLQNDVFHDAPYKGGQERFDMLKKRVVQHNIRVIAEYYDQITTARLCELLGLDNKTAELELSELVCSKFIHAKIDRPAGTIKFGQRQTYADRLNEWSSNIANTLDLVESTCHLIQKEQMVHAARAKLKK